MIWKTIKVLLFLIDMVLKPHPLAATARSHLPQDHIKRATSCSENNSRSAIGIRLESDRAAERGSGTMDTRKGEWVQSAQWYLGLLSTCCCPALSSSHLPRGPGPLSSCLIHGLLSYSLKKASFQIHNNQIPQTTARIMPVDFHSCSLVLTTFSFSRESESSVSWHQALCSLFLDAEPWFGQGMTTLELCKGV